MERLEAVEKRGPFPVGNSVSRDSCMLIANISLNTSVTLKIVVRSLWCADRMSSVKPSKKGEVFRERDHVKHCRTPRIFPGVTIFYFYCAEDGAEAVFSAYGRIHSVANCHVWLTTCQTGAKKSVRKFRFAWPIGELTIFWIEIPKNDNAKKRTNVQNASFNRETIAISGIIQRR